jgi:hypothetical protein
MNALTFVYHYHSIAEGERSHIAACDWQELMHPSGENYWWLRLGDVVHLFDDHASFLEFASARNDERYKNHRFKVLDLKPSR